jgi:hypothetical protein
MTEKLMNVTINEMDIPCWVSYHVENDGIGWYEYWGQKSFDRGSDYPVVDDICPSESQVPYEDFVSAVEYIKTHFEELATKIAEELSEGDFADED